MSANLAESQRMVAKVDGISHKCPDLRIYLTQAHTERTKGALCFGCWFLS